MVDRDEVTARDLADSICGGFTGADRAHNSRLIAAALRAAREEGRREGAERTDMMAGATGYAAGVEAGAREMRDWADRAAGDGVPLDIAEAISLACDRLSDVANLCREIDWYASGDHGDETIRNILRAAGLLEGGGNG